MINHEYWVERQEQHDADLIDEIRRLRKDRNRWRTVADELHEALEIQCHLHRVATETKPYYTQHAIDAMKNYDKAAHGE
jgi:hypothetical protein